MNQSVLEQAALSSELGSMGVVRPDRKKYKKVLIASLMLTSLVDAFSILVVYLLMSYSTSGELMYIAKDAVLPSASQGIVIDQHTIVTFENGKYYIGSEEVKDGKLVKALINERENFKKKYKDEDFSNKLIVQADKDADYKDLNSIILAGSHAGYEEIKFAVMTN